METTPIPPEWTGTPKLFIIVQTKLNKLHDFEQFPLVGVVKTRFINLVEQVYKNWYITPLVKCITSGNTYTKQNIQTCSEWINYERSIVSPSVVIGCGAQIKDFVTCDYYTLSPSKIVESATNEKRFLELLEKSLKEFNGNKP